MGCKSKYIKSQIDYGCFKSKNSRRKGTHIIRQRQKRELRKIINTCATYGGLDDCISKNQ